MTSRKLFSWEMVWLRVFKCYGNISDPSSEFWFYIASKWCMAAFWFISSIISCRFCKFWLCYIWKKSLSLILLLAKSCLDSLKRLLCVFACFAARVRVYFVCGFCFLSMGSRSLGFVLVKEAVCIVMYGFLPTDLTLIRGSWFVLIKPCRSLFGRLCLLQSSVSFYGLVSPVCYDSMPSVW